MLEIYMTKQVTALKDKMVNRLERIDEICDDCWINMHAPTEDELLLVENKLSVPQEFLRYPLDEEERPRIDLDDDTGDVLLIIDIPYVRRDGETARYETAPLGIIITRRNLITVSLRNAPVLDSFISNQVRDFRSSYRTRFSIQILLAVAKDYLKLLRFVDKTLETSERA
ncbi:MAG TPA: CorA family divalent cation transporter, partial [Bacillota bacterium]|nr:CorA family divalent cation transporter [Bacillota bacterium]